ncbi:hypothetical protein KFZ58_02610 [Virgibacillus sp. NKC19-16]|uniref:hypothetical protein n=1 Tax=Virgibacillus salidurans TaxID=2831673 RepID=UPI001F2BA24A|nr:hypothetical protein [Virgibacillus sp. NKC19-16]UJL46862.1 hypothetical protein KFZ58_02610 [Virgibacillus sp. NKC19-16]
MRNHDEKSPNKDQKHNKAKNEIEERTSLDEFEEQIHADDVPLEDLKIEQKDEKKKFKSKDASQSERKIKSKLDDE